MEKSLSHLLAKHSPQTELEAQGEPYLLSADEESRLIEHARNEAIKGLTVKWRLMGRGDSEIEFQLSQINWDEVIDREEIFRRANSIKNHDVWLAEKKKKDREEVAQKKKELEETWTATRIYQLMAYTSQHVNRRKLVVNDWNRKLITALCFFVARDDRFMTELDLDPQKGLLIRGASNLGKTYVVDCIKDNPLNPIKIESMIEIAQQIKDEGAYEIEMGNNRLLYFDDVGTEELEVKHYGTRILFFKNFIETYYFRNKTFNKLIVSTNLNFKEMEEKYGFRVARRMRSMFNVIDVKGDTQYFLGK